MSALTKVFGRNLAIAAILTWPRTAAAGLFIALLVLIVAVPVSQGADEYVMLYPIATTNFGRVLRVSGIADPGQSIRIEANEVVVARTVANSTERDFQHRVAIMRCLIGHGVAEEEQSRCPTDTRRLPLARASGYDRRRSWSCPRWSSRASDRPH